MNPETIDMLGVVPETKGSKDFKGNNQKSYVRKNEPPDDNRKVPSPYHKGNLKHDDNFGD